MAYTVKFHAEVEEDYNEAYAWYEKQKPGLGERFLTIVRRKIEEIAMAPHNYGARTRKSYREAQVDIFPYLVIYKVYKQENTILVISVKHAKRRPRARYRR